MKFATKPIQHYPPHLRHVATLTWEIKTSNFLQIFNRYGRKCKQILHFKCTNFNFSTRVTVCTMLSVLSVIFYQNLVLVNEYHVDC